MNPNKLRQLPAGIKDYLFDEAKQRRTVEKCIRQTLQKNDFREIITPTFEYLDVFGTAGRDGFHDKIYRFLDRDGNLVALRSDFTAQAARIIASKSAALSFPIRIYYSGRIFRFEELHAGLSRETWQVGCELFGLPGITGDVEILQIVMLSLHALKIENFRIVLGTHEFFNGTIEDEKINPDETEELKFYIGHKDMEGLHGWLQRSSFSARSRRALEKIIELHGDRRVLQTAMEVAPNRRAKNAIMNLEEIYDRLEAAGVAEKVIVDLSEIQSLGYYTGVTMKAYVHGIGYEIGTGGRYDQLLTQFGFECPAVGFSFDVDRLVDGMEHWHK